MSARPALARRLLAITLAVLVSGAVATLVAPPATAATVRLQPGADVAAAVAAAAPGDVIELAAGSWPAVRLDRIAKSGDVTIRGVDRSGVVLAGFTARATSHVRLQDVTVRSAAGAP